MKKSGIGVYAVANWDEAGTRHGAFFTFAQSLAGNAKLLVGPGAHCGWNAASRARPAFDIVTEELRFFDYWLKGVQNNVMEDRPSPTSPTTHRRARHGRPPDLAAEEPPDRLFPDGEGVESDKPAKAGTLAAPMVAPVRISSISVTTGRAA